MPDTSEGADKAIEFKNPGLRVAQPGELREEKFLREFCERMVSPSQSLCSGAHGRLDGNPFSFNSWPRAARPKYASHSPADYGDSELALQPLGKLEALPAAFEFDMETKFPAL